MPVFTKKNQSDEKITIKYSRKNKNIYLDFQRIESKSFGIYLKIIKLKYILKPNKELGYPKLKPFINEILIPLPKISTFLNKFINIKAEESELTTFQALLIYKSFEDFLTINTEGKYIYKGKSLNSRENFIWRDKYIGYNKELWENVTQNEENYLDINVRNIIIDDDKKEFFKEILLKTDRLISIKTPKFQANNINLKDKNSFENDLTLHFLDEKNNINNNLIDKESKVESYINLVNNDLQSE